MLRAASAQGSSVAERKAGTRVGPPDTFSVLFGPQPHVARCDGLALSLSTEGPRQIGQAGKEYFRV